MSNFKIDDFEFFFCNVDPTQPDPTTDYIKHSIEIIYDDLSEKTKQFIKDGTENIKMHT